MNELNEDWLEEINHANIKISKPVEKFDNIFDIIQRLQLNQRVGGVPLIFRGQGMAPSSPFL